MVWCIQIKSLLIVCLIGSMPFYAWNYRDIHKNKYLHCRYKLKFQNYILQPEFIQIALKILRQLIPYLNSLAILSHYWKASDYLLFFVTKFVKPMSQIFICVQRLNIRMFWEYTGLIRWWGRKQGRWIYLGNMSL